MLIKKFTANTETEAIKLAQEELGKDAIVLNVKTKSPRGIYKLFRSVSVEVTAAVDENISPLNRRMKETPEAAVRLFSDVIPEPEEVKPSNDNHEETKQLEKKLENLQTMLEKQIQEKPIATTENQISDDKNLNCLKLIYNQLLDNEVDEKYANQIISEIEQTLKKDAPINQILASIYQKIVLKLGTSLCLELSEGRPKYVFFIGPTGVGKTTTIAKIAASLSVEKKQKVALVTSDTYRIAAVEQLRTYANILEIPIYVLYETGSMEEAREQYKNYDVVLVDTAGRSHRSRQQRDDIEQLILSVPEEEREIYLVLSVTTKYKDLLKIADTYSQISDYRLIFTKLDETSCLGNILNLRMATGAPLSYSTFGQNVPQDIGKTDAQMIAKQLLGGND